MAGAESTDAVSRRRRGNRAGLTPARIIQAAREIPPDDLTVKAVADQLGVDRAAIHHHVRDLDTLREMIARDAFHGSLAPVVIPAGANWQDACRVFAISMHDAMLAAGGLGAYIQFSLDDVGALEPVERTLRTMMAAGFDDETAARSLATLSTLAMAIARERLQTPQSAGHPQVPELREALRRDHPAEAFAVLRRLADADLVTFDDTQLFTSVDLVLDGMASRLRASQA
jgi:TetR/AcrR family tetracycline transcriptional repressor